jgi:two-component system CheB/CheR fusion protein
MAVQAMKAGFLDFIEKPISRRKLLASVSSAMEKSPDSSERLASQRTVFNAIASLTLRQHRVLDMSRAHIYGRTERRVFRT